MTAAHCVDGATSMKVFLGAHNVREDAEVISKMSKSSFWHLKQGNLLRGIVNWSVAAGSVVQGPKKGLGKHFI